MSEAIQVPQQQFSCIRHHSYSSLQLAFLSAPQVPPPSNVPSDK
ncbi:hypothetical protein Hanom_Chr15g01370311 [Helianthus anomalus]